MPDNKGKKNKHLTIDDRIEIQACLDRGMTFKAIGRRVGKDQTTISKEVKKHITYRSKEGAPADEDICPLLLRASFVCNPCKKRRFSEITATHCHYFSMIATAISAILSRIHPPHRS